MTRFGDLSRADQNVCFVDCETTGLDPDRHSIWEVALITPDGSEGGREHVWQFPVVEIEADPFALDIGRWWDRRWEADVDVTELDAIYEAHNEKSRRKHFPDQGRAIKPSESWCRHFRHLTTGTHLCGAVPSFDEERLRRLLRSRGVVPRWHYHLIDVEALAAGYVIGRCQSPIAQATSDEVARPPWKSNDLSRAVGVDPDQFDRHTALGDARWAKAIYERVMTDG